MLIKTLKLDNGEIFKYDENSPHFQNYAKQISGFANSTRNFNQDDSVFGARQLEYIRQKIYEPKYAELKFINGGLIPLNTAIPEGYEVDTYDIMDGVGEAKVAADFSDDVPTTEVVGSSKSGNIKSILTSYIYTIQDLRKDKIMSSIGKSSVEKKAMLARKVIDTKLDKMLRVGDTQYGIKGLFNADGVPITAAAATGSGGLTTFASKTGQQILDDFASALSDMNDASKGTETPDTCLIDHKNWLLLKNKPLDVTMYSGMSVLKYIEQEYQIKFEWVSQIQNSFVNNTKSAFILYKKDPEKLEAVLPIRLMNHLPQAKNLATKTILEARCGGVRVFYPKSVSITTGI